MFISRGRACAKNDHMIRCGEKHAMALDIEGYVWVFLSWGRPFRIITPQFDRSSPETTVVQIECATHECYVLTGSGAVYTFSPYRGKIAKLYEEKILEMHGAEDRTTVKINDQTNDQTIHCKTFDLSYDPEKLPDLPVNLPKQDDKSETKETGSPKITMIAALRSYLVGVTTQGHVLKFRLGSLRLKGLEEGWTYVRIVNIILDVYLPKSLVIFSYRNLASLRGYSNILS